IILFGIHEVTVSNFRLKLTPQAYAPFKPFMVKVNEPDHCIVQIGFACKSSAADHTDVPPDIGYARGQPTHDEDDQASTPAPAAQDEPVQFYERPFHLKGSFFFDGNDHEGMFTRIYL